MTDGDVTDGDVTDGDGGCASGGGETGRPAAQASARDECGRRGRAVAERAADRDSMASRVPYLSSRTR